MNDSINPIKLIHKYYANHPIAEDILMQHSQMVTQKALTIARYLVAKGEKVDLRFIAEAALLHDIGMINTNTPSLSCYGTGDYITHGLKGKKLLLHEGLPAHARVCERHIGVGLTAKEIKQQKLPLPIYDILPETLEEQIICYADLFYSKNKGSLTQEKTPDEVRAKLKEFGNNKIETFNRWQYKFEAQLK